MSTDSTPMTDDEPTPNDTDSTDDDSERSPDTTPRAPDGTPYPHRVDEIDDTDREVTVPLSPCLERRIRAELDPDETVADYVLASTAARLARADHARATDADQDQDDAEQLVLDVDPAFRELLEREVARTRHDDVESLATTWLWVTLTETLTDRLSQRYDVAVDVPREVLETAELMRDVNDQGSGEGALTDVLLNYFVELDPDWRTATTGRDDSDAGLDTGPGGENTQ